MRIYLAGNWQSQDRLKVVRTKLEALGHHVINGWLDESEEAQKATEIRPRDAEMYAYRDIGEVVSCDRLILDVVEPQNDSCGHEVEYGMALALGKSVWIVGPNRNIFHSIARRRFDDWSECFAVLLRESF